MSKTRMNSYPWAWDTFPIIYENMQVAQIQLGGTSIRLIWSVQGERHTYTVNFPRWGCEMPIDQRQYRLLTWECLAITMLTLAGFVATEKYIFPVDRTQFDEIKPIFFDKEDCVENLSMLHARLEKAVQH